MKTTKENKTENELKRRRNRRLSDLMRFSSCSLPKYRKNNIQTPFVKVIIHVHTNKWWNLISSNPELMKFEDNNSIEELINFFFLSKSALNQLKWKYLFHVLFCFIHYRFDNKRWMSDFVLSTSFVQNWQIYLYKLQTAFNSILILFQLSSGTDTVFNCENARADSVISDRTKQTQNTI